VRPHPLTPWLFLAPAAIVYALLRIVPLLGTIALSFADYRGLGTPLFVGFANYARMLADPVFWSAVRNNLLWGFGEVLVSISIGLFLAVLLTSRIRLRVLFRTTLFLPVILSWAVAGMLWGRVYHPAPSFGLLNHLLLVLGRPDLMGNWLGDAGTALYAVIVAAIWKGFGFSMVIFLAGLQDIPPELHEAAQLDGATGWQSFWAVTLPLLRPIVSVVLVLGLIDTFRVFDPIWVMTQGGPGNASAVLGTQVYQTAFAQFNLGYGSTIAIALLAFALAASAIYLRAFGRTEAR
jgi:ABC-type sugar transport system permease subunit